MKPIVAVYAASLAIILGGCANPVAKHYVQLAPPTVAKPTAVTAEVQQVQDLSVAEKWLSEKGWEKVGKSEFSSLDALQTPHVLQQAAETGATVVIWHRSSKRQRAPDIVVTNYERRPETKELMSSQPEVPERIVRTKIWGADFVEHFYTISFWRPRVS